MCSRSCAGKELIGSKNPNFSNKWGSDQKKNLSNKMKIEAELVNTEEQQKQLGELGVEQMMQQVQGAM